VCKCLFGVQIGNVDATIFLDHVLGRVGMCGCSRPMVTLVLIWIGDMMALHCFGVNVVAGSGYTGFHMMTFHRLKLLSHRPNREFFILRCHTFAVSTRYASSVSMLPSCTSRTPSVCQASDGSSCWMVTCLCELSSIVMWLGA